MSENEKKKIMFSGMQPTGLPSIGNYIGAIKNWVNLSDEYNSLFCVVDLHSLTVKEDPQEKRRKTRSLFMLYVAAGLDPVKNILYCQSHVPHHSELAWILNCYTYMGELSRMTQFKEKSQKHEDNINAGLFTYPVLMAADILLYQTDVVPVGEDQKQHLELSRDVAARFNNLYGDTFVVPEPYISKTGARIMGLQEPTRKMSKSDTDNPNDAVFLLDEPNLIMNKIKRAVTDSENTVRFDPQNQPGVANLLTIYGCLGGKTIEEAEKDFDGRGYGDLKEAVGETVVSALRPIQEEYKRLEKDKAYIDEVMAENAKRAAGLAERTMKKVRRKIGIA